MSKEICKFIGKEMDCLNCKGHRENWTDKGGHIIHMGQSISGPVSRDDKKDWRKMANYITIKGGCRPTPMELREYFRYLLYGKGWDVIPIGECDNFCYKNGCQGHKAEEENEEEAT